MGNLIEELAVKLHVAQQDVEGIMDRLGVAQAARDRLATELDQAVRAEYARRQEANQ